MSRRRPGKRLFDIAVATGAVALLLLPFVFVALWIRADSPGPVFFRQPRVGRGGRHFRIHKLRTMRVAGGAVGGAGAAATGPLVTAGEADPRITRAGRFLRARRLDELPQFIDVLVGDMSLVGPRPEVPRFVAMWPPDLAARVLAVRPGMTDASTLAFLHEEAILAAAADPERAYVEQVMGPKLEAAARAVDEATFAGDLRVLARTVARLARGGPA
jgi:lipopolysaccharide/colanic/teichoic acid biosynthesis glycosyltransferase